jgi:hypothetical protein
MPSSPRLPESVRAEAARRRAQEELVRSGPVVVPNFGSGPVGDTIVNGRVVTEQQRFADANQAYLDAQREVAAREATAEAERQANINRIVGIARERAAKLSITNSLRGEAWKIGPPGVGVLKTPPTTGSAPLYSVNSRNGITRERLLETADWVEQNYNASEFNTDPTKKSAFMTEFTQRVSGKDAVVVATPESKFGQVKSPTDLIRAAKETIQEQALKALEPVGQDYGKTSKFNPYDSSQYVRRGVNVPVNIEGKSGGDLPVWLYDVLSNAYGKIYPNAPTRGNQYFYEDSISASLARAADVMYTGDEQSQKQAVSFLKAADLISALNREGYNVKDFNSIPANVIDFLADEKQQGNYAFDLRNFFGGDANRTVSDAIARTTAATKVNRETFLKAYADSLPPGPRSRNFIEGFINFLKVKGGEALTAALEAPTVPGARGGAAGVAAAETVSAADENKQSKLTVGEMISFLSEPVNRVAWTPYYATQLAADKGKSPWSAMGLGLKALASGFSPYEAGGEDKQIIQSVDSYEDRQVLREQGLLPSFGENLMYDIRKLAVWLGTGKTDGGRYDVNLSNSPFLLGGVGYLVKALVEAAPEPVSGISQIKWSGVVDGAATVAFDPVSWTPFIAAKIGGKPFQLAARMGTRTVAAQIAEREAAKLTQRATMNAALSVVGGDSPSILTRAAGSGRTVLSIAQDEAYRLASKGKAWLRPSTVFKDTTIWTQQNAADAVTALSVGQQARVSAEKVGRAAYLTYGTGRNYINAIEEVIDTVGPNIKLLKKKLPSVPEAIIQDVVDAILKGRKVVVNGTEHTLSGLDAAMLVVRDAVVTGKMDPKITLRRQVVASIDDNLRRIPGVSNPTSRATLTTGMSGRSVPFLFGASPVKPTAGRLTLALEKGAGRIASLYSPLVTIGVPNKVNEFALRMQQQLKIPQSVFDDIVRQADEEFGDDVATRLARLFEIGQQNADQLPGLDLLVTDLSIGLRGVDVPIQLKTVRNLEVAVELTLNSADETIADAGSHFVAEISGKSLNPKNPIKGAETRANAVLGRAKVLSSKADEIPPPSRGGLTGSVIKGTKVKSFNRQRAMVESEAERISEKIASGAKVTSRDTHRLSLIEKLTAAINGVVNLAERRRMLYAIYEVNVKTVQDTFDKAIEVAGKNLDDVIESEEVLKGVIDNYSGRDTLTEFETEYLSKVREELDVVKTTIVDARAEVKELKAKFASDLAGLKSQWQREGRMLDGLESRWSKEVASAETDLRRFGAVAAAGAKESTPVEKVLAVSGLNPETFEDSLLSRIAAVYQDIGLTTVEPLGIEFDEVLTAAVTPNPTKFADDALEEASSVPIDVTQVEVANVIGGTIDNPGRTVLYARINKLPPALRDRFIGKVDKAVKSGKDLSAIARDVETLLAQPSFAKVVAEQVVHEDSLASWLVQNYPARQAAATVKRGAARKVGRGLAKIPLSVIESVAPATVRYASTDNPYVSMQNRVEDIDRIAADYGFDQATRNLIALAAIEARNQDELYALIREMQKVWAIHMDIPYKNIMKAQNTEATRFFAKIGFDVDDSGNLIGNIQMSAQRGNMLPVLSASEARSVASEYIAKAPKGSQFGTATRYAASNRVAFDAAVRGKLGKTGRFIHKIWKFSAVTGVPAIGVGVVGGFIAGDPYEDGLMGWDSFQWAAIGGLIGSLGGIRYIGRVAGIEEALVRYPMVRGFNPLEYIPGLSKMKSNWGVARANHHWDELVGSVRHPMNAGEANKLLVTVGENWVSLDPAKKNFIEAWMRAANRQIQPDVYLVDRLLLENFDDLQKFRELATEYFKTDLGKVELQRLRGGLGGAKNVDEILERMENFVGKYLPTVDLRMQRLGAGIDGISKDTFKQHLAAGIYPESVHARQQWLVPKSWTQAKQTALQLYPRLVMEVPTTKINRVRLAENIYGSEYRRLIKAGIDPTTAKNLAESYSLNLTNKVMFQLSDESRFADSVDYVFPFQQPREELLRVYGMLAVQNPTRIWSMTEIGARAFNNGVESGIFYEDAFGEWRMRVPGSVWLSEKMSGPAAGFDFKVRDAFFLLQGNAFAAYSQSPDFTLDSPANLLMGTLPAPGGPYWAAAVRFAANQFPDVFTDLSQNNTWIYNRLFPYGIEGTITNPNVNRFWMAFFHSAPPWEFSDQKEQAERLRLIEIDIANELAYENRNNPNYLTSIESGKGKKEFDDEVYKRVTGLLLAWTVVASVTPAATQPILPGKKENSDLISRLKKQYGDGWYDIYVTTRPDLAEIYGVSKYKNSDDLSFEQWKKTSGVDAVAKSTDRVVAYDLEEYTVQLRKARVSAKLSRELDDAYNGFYLTESDRYQSVAEIERKYSEFDVYKIDFRNSYYKKKELARIVYTLDASQQEGALNEWRSHFEVSFPEYKSLLKTIRAFTFDARKEARNIEQILYGAKDSSGNNVGPMGVDEAGRSGLNREAYIKGLPAAEQEKYWQYVMSTITYTDVTQSDIEKYGLSTAEYYAGNEAMDAVGYWENANRALNLVYATNKDLFNKSNLKVPSPTDEMVKTIRDGGGAYLDAVNLKLVDARAARDNAYTNKDWSTYNAAKNRVNSLMGEKNAILGDVYKKFTDLEQLQSDIKSIFYLQNNPDKKSSQASAELYEKRMAELGIPTFAFDSEEKNYIKMSTDVRAAYRRSLITRLGFDKGENGKLHWEHLTPFQRDLLEKMALPEEQLELWKKGSYSSGGGSSAASDLEYAYSLMKQYNRRPAGAKAPAAYNEYLKIPNSNSVAKSNFLKQNPEVADWIKLGPLANMPTLDRMIVANIMVKNGKWEGEEMDSTEITNLAWAREQLKMWSRRTGDKPVTYDLWLNMPSGPEKAEYLRLNPEIQQWISMGPMSNMPENYREVVRDIMYRFGEWSASTDPLGETITGFYSQPASKRQAYLDAHPELIEYWRAIRTPEEQKMADLTEAYFKIPDGAARRVFLTAHPELNDYFVDSRTRRYEKFMNKVAIYMGSNPSVFKEYLDRQEGILSELLERFAMPPMVREVVPKAPKSGGYGTSGRVRSVSGANR